MVKANSALNGWVDFSPFRCGFQLSVALDGTLSVTNLGGTVYLLPAGSSSWIGPFSSSNGPVTKMVVQNKNTAYALIGGTVFYFNVTAQTFTIMPSLSGTSGTDLAIDADGLLWFTGATNSSGNGNVYSATVFGANYYHKTPYRGFLTSISVGLGNYTMGVSGTTAYHFNRIVPFISMSLTGNYDCSTFVNGQCPQGSMHTASVSVRFQSHTQGGHNYLSVSGPPSTNFTLTAYDFSNCDLIFGNPFSPECQITSSAARVICSVMGTILAYIPVFSIDEELAFTWAEKTSLIAGSCDNADYPLTECSYNTTPVCDAAHTPPDYNTYVGRDYKFFGDDVWGWLAGAECFSIKMPAPGGWLGWTCSLGEALPIYGVHAPGYCTKRAPGTGSGWDF